MSAKVLSAGDHSLSRCSKCKETTNHTIVAMVGDRIARVECNVCGSVHNHRGTTAPTIRPESGRRPAAAPRRTGTQARWEAEMAGAGSQTPIPYSTKAVVKTGNVIAHPSFGTGRVISTTRPNKMEVMFEQGVKLLICSVAD